MKTFGLQDCKHGVRARKTLQLQLHVKFLYTVKNGQSNLDNFRNLPCISSQCDVKLSCEAKRNDALVGHYTT